MNRIILILSLAASLAAAACSKTPAGDYPLPDSQLTVTLGGLPDAATKATPGTAAENALGNLHLFVFDESGMLDISHRCEASELNARKAVLRLKTGTKTVCALANLNEALAARAHAVFRLADLQDLGYSLGDNAAGALVMRGLSSGVSVTAAAGGSTTVDLVRGVGRVALASVTNKLPAPYGSVTVLRAFLCNVAGNQNIRGDAVTTDWLNREATSGHVAGHVIGTGSYGADCPALTFAPLGTAVALNETKNFTDTRFYAFPNALTSPNNGFHDSFTPTATVLMVVVQIQGQRYYYPIPLSGGVAENTEYSVHLTLAGLGNTEDKPFAKIDKGNLTAVVRVRDWTSTNAIVETI